MWQRMYQRTTGRHLGCTSVLGLCIGLLVAAGIPAHAETIETGFIEAEWPKQLVRELEVGRYPIRWRQASSRQGGIFAGVSFAAPLPREQVWDRLTDYEQIGHYIPGVAEIRFVEQATTRKVIVVELDVLLRHFWLTIEIQEVEPQTIRFRLLNVPLGEFSGIIRFHPSRPVIAEKVHTNLDQGKGVDTQGGVETPMDMSMWVRPVRSVPGGLLLTVARMTLLHGVRSFLTSCESRSNTSR